MKWTSILFLLIITSCSEKSTPKEVKSSLNTHVSFDKEFKDFRNRLYLKINQSDSLYSNGRYFNLGGDSIDVIVIAEKFGTINKLIDSLERFSSDESKGILVYLTNPENENKFRLINYSELDSAFYQNRLAVGMYSKNTKFENDHFQLLRFKIFER